jgi:hypothetical protein
MSNTVWDFIITDSMIEHLDMNELGLFFNSLEDAIEEVCTTYNVEVSEVMSDVD